MHIPAALHRDTAELPRPRSLLVLPAAVFPLLVVVLPFVTMGAVFDLHRGWWGAAAVAALSWSVVAGYVAKSPKPLHSFGRLLGWIALWCLEPFAVLLVLGPVAATHEVTAVVVGVLYVLGALACGHLLFRHYRSKR
ncbi:hypothetical protein [Lentzea sp. NBRC 102530]|uniref:hypothetical protein n=1 Tax=Lentzea sp. NBRC 102530 TaxID=3032201 RepID=UPI0024A23538|nr:hypothetical protein [Lentzea sp. NBRC 102530]GLY49348.1 hypothetical protein Lesp01_30040 [Lentzea sp. NBRC 102530]